MKIGFIGLGKMGARMVERLLQHKHEVVVYNLTQPEINDAISKGAIGVSNLQEMVQKLDEYRIIWLMIPAGKAIDDTIEQLTSLLQKGDIIIDGGNSYWRDSVDRSQRLQTHGIHYVDCGTSGGVWGLENGYCLMYGGNKGICKQIEPIFHSLAPKDGYIYCGNSGSGHMIKMVHNGIEYGMMQAYAEGFEIIKNSPYNINLENLSNIWMQGSVIRSWLLELIRNALHEDQDLEDVKDFVQDSGEGRWTVQTAMDFNVPAHAITASLFARFQSRQESSFAMKLLAAMRNQFGGHEIKKK